MDLLLLLALATLLPVATMASKPRAFLVLGDSLVDQGNNNYRLTLAKANHPPHGIDYPSHKPTGRFTNGKNLADIICETMGVEPTLPYLSPELTGKKLLVGANFASSGAGILKNTGNQFLDIIKMNEQLEYLKEYKKRVRNQIGQTKARRLMNRAVVLITLGGNDFLNNYYGTDKNTFQQLTMQEFVSLLIKDYHKILNKLHKLGARKVLVSGLGPLGCTPGHRAILSRSGECDAELNRAVDLFSHQLEQKLSELNGKIGADVFVAANTQQTSYHLMHSPKSYGFRTSKMACCGQGKYNGEGFCTPMSNVCSDRDLYVYWDKFHPTERTFRILANFTMNGSTKYMKPFNLSTILAGT